MTDATTQPPRGWNIALWVIQVLLAFSFGMAGFVKLVTPYPDLIDQMVWPEAVPEGLLRAIASAEILGAVGLILPGILRIQPQLTKLAAAGLLTVMFFAAIFHATRGEFEGIGANAFLGLLAFVVAWGRWKKAPL